MKSLFALAALATLTVGPAYAGCLYPPPPEKIPDGRTATRDEMIAAQKEIKAYDTAINAYLACIDLERDDSIAKAGEKLTKEQKDDLERVHTQKHNAAVEKLQDIADRFNEQVRVYNGKDKDKKG